MIKKSLKQRKFLLNISFCLIWRKVWRLFTKFFPVKLIFFSNSADQLSLFTFFLQKIFSRIFRYQFFDWFWLDSDHWSSCVARPEKMKFYEKRPASNPVVSFCKERCDWKTLLLFRSNYIITLKNRGSLDFVFVKICWKKVMPRILILNQKILSHFPLESDVRIVLRIVLSKHQFQVED